MRSGSQEFNHNFYSIILLLTSTCYVFLYTKNTKGTYREFCVHHALILQNNLKWNPKSFIAYLNSLTLSYEITYF